MSKDRMNLSGFEIDHEIANGEEMQQAASSYDNRHPAGSARTAIAGIQ